MNRREFVQGATMGLAAIGLGGTTALGAMKRKEPLFTISLAQWSLHRALQKKELDHLDFPKVAKETYGIDAVEYVNSFFARKGDMAYVKELKKRCSDHGVTSLLIMCDGEGALGDADEAKRKQAVENHYKWADAAKELGCHSIRVNAQSSGTFGEQQDRAADGLRRLAEYTDTLGLYTIVENHWGLSSQGDWLVGVMKKVNHPRIGTLPDFGNFDPKQYDRYQGVQDMMPYARGVSAKSHVFDAKGDESEIDYRRMMKIVLDAGYHGRLGIEYEGDKHSEAEGIRLTKALLEKVRDEMSAGA
jgi:sugar phosphate isomerase/epimerase